MRQIESNANLRERFRRISRASWNVISSDVRVAAPNASSGRA
jgi:hypothetical protein